MSHLTSPPLDDRSVKRSRTSLQAQSTDDSPESVIDIVPNGDATLVLSGMSTAPKTPIGLRVSQHALGMASSIFKAAFAAAVMASFNENTEADANPPGTIIRLPDDDADAMYILCNILHLRNDKLPARILPEVLCKLAYLARKYECVVAAGRATLQWFDRLHTSKNPGDVWQIIEAAFLLDEAMFFARLTTRWVLEQSLHLRQVPSAGSTDTQRLALMLSDRHNFGTMTLRNDVDGVVDACAQVLSKQCKHYIDWPPGTSPTASETPTSQPPVECAVDSEGAALYLGALRDAQIWPSTTWERPTTPAGLGTTICDIVVRLGQFREPDYNDVDKCECCEGIKIKFTEQLDITKDTQRDRLWGLCLDCYKAGGFNAGECRYEHPKPQQGQQAQTGGLGIDGL